MYKSLITQCIRIEHQLKRHIYKEFHTVHAQSAQFDRPFYDNAFNKQLQSSIFAWFKHHQNPVTFTNLIHSNSCTRNNNTTTCTTTNNYINRVFLSVSPQSLVFLFSRFAFPCTVCFLLRQLWISPHITLQMMFGKKYP